jgi:hypothetical protein
MGSRLATACCAVVVLSIATTVSSFAQTAPPGAAAPVPSLPAAPAPPPNTTVPPAMSDIPTMPVTFDYFGSFGLVSQFTLPQGVRSTGSMRVWSASDGTPEEAAQAVQFGERPAGSEFIVFFARGSRMYAFDTSTGNYCWIEGDITRG